MREDLATVRDILIRNVSTGIQQVLGGLGTKEQERIQLNCSQALVFRSVAAHVLLPAVAR